MVFPEATMCSFFRASTQVAGAPDGSWASVIRRLADDLGITITVGVFIKAPGARVYNMPLTMGESESRRGKIHLLDTLGQHESETVAPEL